MDIICNKWPLDGSQKTFQGTVAWRAGTLNSLIQFSQPIHVEHMSSLCSSVSTQSRNYYYLFKMRRINLWNSRVTFKNKSCVNLMMLKRKQFCQKLSYLLLSFILSITLFQINLRQTLYKSNVQKQLRIATGRIFRENIFYIFEKLNNQCKV